MKYRENDRGKVMYWYWNLNNEWHGVNQISRGAVWWSVILLFFSSLIPYAIRLVHADYNSSTTQCFYGIIVFLVTISNVVLSCALERANHTEQDEQLAATPTEELLNLDILKPEQ